MKNYVLSTRITAALTVVSLLFLLIIHYLFDGTEANFWCNVFLAIFGSGFLTFIVSCIGYSTEKRRALEGFRYSTLSLLHFINQYEFSWTLQEKIDFFIEYNDLDKSLWDANLGAICFMYDPKRKKFKYIYKKIYQPILELNQKIAIHQAHFRWHKDGSGKNNAVMTEFVTETEALIMEIRTVNSSEDDECQITSYQNILVHNILEELNGTYYRIMYGKRVNEREDS